MLFEWPHRQLQVSWPLCDKLQTVSFSSSFQRDGDPEKEETVGAEETTMEPDCVRCPPSVQWLDLGQSLVYDHLLGQYSNQLRALSSKALWLQLHVPPAGNTVGSINLQDNHRVFQIMHQISQALETGRMVMSSRWSSVFIYLCICLPCLFCWFMPCWCQFGRGEASARWTNVNAQ